MGWIFPNSTIHLLQNVPLTNAYIHTTDYANATAQYTDFMNYRVATYDNYTYIRNGMVKIEGTMSVLYAVNYMMFKNTSYENKWIYAFVTDVSYLNDNTVVISYDIDIMQTWQFDYTVKPSYIEREIVAHDTLFGNLTEEELEIGEYELKDMVHPSYFNAGNLCALVGVSRKIKDNSGDFTISANLLYGMPTYETYYMFTNPSDLQQFYKYYADNGNTDDILEMVLFPSGFVNASDFATDSQGFKYLKSTDGQGHILSVPYVYLSLDKAVKGTTAFNTYVPKNAKMYNSPYFKIVCSDLEGNSAEYSPEYFYTDLNPQASDPNAQLTTKMYFLMSMPINSIPQPCVIPQFYKSRDFVYNKSYIFIGAGFGQMPLVTDTYAAWYAMNSAQLQNQYNILASTKQYVGRSGAANTDLASINTAAVGENLNYTSTANRFGLAGGAGPSVMGVNALTASVQSGNALKRTTAGNAVLSTGAQVLDYMTRDGLSDDINETLGVLTNHVVNQSRYDMAQARKERYQAVIKEAYDNVQAQLAIQGLQAKITDAQTMSPSVRGMGNSNITAALNQKGITLMLVCITDDYARRIDRYLSIYGYKVNEVSSVNTKSRQNWNYIKTVGANVAPLNAVARLPHSALIGIRNIFDSGVTFWHNGLANVFNYGTFDNPEVI